MAAIGIRNVKRGQNQFLPDSADRIEMVFRRPDIYTWSARHVKLCRPFYASVSIQAANLVHDVQHHDIMPTSNESQ